MKIAWFSPLPPAPSDIANFTQRLAGELAARYETHFFTEAAAGFQEAAGTIYPAALGAVSPGLWPVLNRLDVPVYNLGNHPGFFAHTWFLSQRKPGIVVLHDLKLHHFFEGIYRERLGDQGTYLKLLRRYHGSLGYEAGVAYWQQEVSVDFMAEHFPMTAWAVEGALGIVVHTPHALRVVRAQTDVPVALAPLPYPSRMASGVSEHPPESRSIENRRVQLVIFGYLNVNRRVVEFLKAWAAMPEQGRFEVQIYGEIQHRAEVENTLDVLGLRGQVTLHGHVSEAELEGGLSRADLAVNLRYPSLGEASGSQLRLWDHALPSLVTLTEGYATLPADAVFFVRPEHETADIQAHLRRLLAQPEIFRQAGRNGRRHLRAEHRAETYVERLEKLIEQVGELRSRHNQQRLADRTGAATAPWSDATPQTAREWHYAATITGLG